MHTGNEVGRQSGRQSGNITEEARKQVFSNNAFQLPTANPPPPISLLFEDQVWVRDTVVLGISK
jgi:hypothetical protein